MDFNQRHRRPVEDKSPSSVYKQRQNGRNQDSDFRKQIHSRDEEIFMLSQTNDHLRQRLDQTVAQQNRTTSQVEQKHIAPLRVKEGSRSRSPMRPQRDSSPGNFRSAPGYARDHIAALQNDNASLMRRLNLVLQELERVTQEKNSLLDQVDGSSKDIDEMHRIINSEDNTDKINRYMQEDLGLERQQNTELRDRIKDNERTSANLVQELKKLQNDGEVKADENTHCDSELRHKVESIKHLESEHYYTVEKIKQCERLIQECRNEEAIDQRQKAQLQHKIGVLINERNELLQKLEQLTHKYDQTVREITADRQLITQHNKRQSNLVTAKIVFTLLETLQKQRKTQALDEMKSYCLFDLKCQKKLGAFASTGQRQGQKLMKLALQLWFQNALEPTDKMNQSSVLIEKTRENSLKSTCFHLWREAFIDRIKKYEEKTEAVKALQRYLKKDTKIEIARYFQIWKDDTQRLEAQKRQIQRLIWRKYFNKLNQGFNAWAGYSHYLDDQIRLRMLAAEYAQKNYQTAIFHNFKVHTMESKRKKFSRQLQAFKAWKDYHNKRKFFFHNNLATGQILKQNQTWLLKVCFDAFAKNKETRKYEKAHESLVETEQSKVELGAEIQENTERSKLKDNTMAFNVLRTMLGKQVVSYFLRWKQETQHGKNTMNLRVKQRIIKAYTTHLRQYFNIWKKQQNRKIRNLQKQEIQVQQAKAQELTNQTLELKKEVEEKQKIKDCKGKQGIHKVFRKMERRQLEQAVARWRDVYNFQLQKEQRARIIIKRYRANYFRQAFDRYKAGVARKKKEQLCEARCFMFLQTQDERIKKLAYESIKLFVERHVAARESFKRLDTRLNISRKRQGFKRWQKWNQRKLEKTLKNEQNTMTQQIVELNDKQGQLFQHEENQKNSLKQQKGQLGKQAQRIISNAFARYYYTGLTRGFEKWREFNQFQQHKEQIIKRTEMRLRRNQLYFVKSAFRNWMLAADVAERTKQLKTEEQKVEDTHFQLELQTKKFQEAQSNYHEELERLKEDSIVQNKRYQQSVQIVISQMENNHYMSRQKYIFQQWALFVRRQKHFITSTINVINKSQWKEGFTQIKNAARNNDFEAKKERVLEQFRRKFYKRTCGNAFSKWKENGYKKVLQTVHMTESETNQVIEAHQEKKEQFKQCNMDKAQNHLHKQRLRHLWTGWVTVKNLLKFHRIKDEETKDSLGYYQKKKALQKWSSRLRATKQARFQVSKMKEELRLMRLRLYFDQMKLSRDIHNGMMNRLNNFAKVFDHHQCQYAFKMIDNYVVSKKVSHQKSKAVACEDLLKALQKLLKKEQQQTLCQLKVIPLLRYKSGLKRFNTIMKNLTAQQRTAFGLWKEGAKKRTLFKEMNEEGPIKEEIWFLNQQQANLRQFMLDEGYAPEDIQKLEKHGEKKQEYLLNKSKKRIEHYNEEKFPLPKYFDRWRKWIAFKKIMRYHLNFAANRAEYLKADMASAFTQWKFHDEKLQKVYAAIPKSKLEQRVIKNCEQIDGLAEDIGEKEAELGHLDIQREELMENYIKGQKLALALWMANRKRGMHKAFSRWMNATRGSKQEEADQQMKHNMNIITELKERQRQLEEENQNFDEENTDLRQLTVDGYTMAQNAQKLEAEREQLSVDLADKAKTIKQLLQENEQLKFDLQQKQEEANNILRTIKKSERNNFSPMVKSGY